MRDCLIVYGGSICPAFDNQGIVFMLYFPDSCGESIAAPSDGVYVLTPLRAHSQNLPELINVLGKVGFLDKSVGPDLLHQLIFLDYVAAAFDERKQGVEGLQCYWNNLPIAQ